MNHEETPIFDWDLNPGLHIRYPFLKAIENVTVPKDLK
jgi:hypothetical protein